MKISLERQLEQALERSAARHQANRGGGRGKLTDAEKLAKLNAIRSRFTLPHNRVPLTKLPM